VNEPGEELRRLVAAVHGLEPKAATFLTGSCVEELEQSAAKLAALLGKPREPEVELGFFERATMAKLERKHELAMILTGRAQPRDDQGRWTTKPAASFDGGARQPAPFRQPPEIEHNKTLLEAMHSGDSNVGASF
jgi:hypothetical protein